MDRAFKRLPHHVGIIPDGNRRWAVARGGAKREGYVAGIEPGLRLLSLCRELGIEEVSVYGFTKENMRRPSDQVKAFRDACIEMSRKITGAGMALRVLGDADSPVFPGELNAWSERSPGDLRVNLLVNYGWQWDIAGSHSADIPRIELVVRWGGHCHAIDTLWPDMREEEFLAALRWHERQDVTLGG